MTDDNFTMSENLINISDNAKNLFDSIELKTKIFENESFFIDLGISKPANIDKVNSAMIMDYFIYIESQTQSIVNDNLEKDKTINKLKNDITILNKKLIESKESTNPHDTTLQNEVTINFSDNDYEIIKTTAIYMDTPITEIIKDCAMTSIKRLATMFKKGTASKLPGSATDRITILIDNIINFNENTTDNNLRIFINKSIVGNMLGTNFYTLKEYFAKNQKMIDEHHAKYGITPSHNVKKPLGWQLKDYVDIPE